VLAILCDFGDRDPGEVVTYIVRRLQELLGKDERGFREYMNMLEVLSENRELRARVEEAEHMLTQVEIERLPSFAIGFERGEAKGMEAGREAGMEAGREEGMEAGREAGREAGMEAGREEGQAQVVRRLLRRLDMTKTSELLDLSPEEVRRIAAAGNDDHSERDRH
ncbi:MAG: hypothetical protein LGR52_12980, partial [Candidatus Thiosymbion ectosymbiont of Robbea hypermnestra]|nr:hypothetical protein [Candidatus Thiosymbion ectosymbiont of Robbea hypermnestra]